LVYNLTFTTLIMIMFWGYSESFAQKTDQPQTVPFVDLNRYVGRWYEIAKIPNRFQKKCHSNTTAEYRLLENGKIEVINRCMEEDGKIIETKGVAKVEDPTSNAKLKVSFVRILGLYLFWGDYWIIGLGNNYEYAIVGSPNRKYGWILSRESSLSQENLEEIFSLLRLKGYNPDDFQITIQENN
jgi:apolipoprotein D and lipocalin family protein